jgi:hypothetical protein
VDEMPLMYEQNSLQMEWCLNCHRNPAGNLRPTSEIYNMAWAGPSSDKPVWCTVTQNTNGTNVPTAQGVSCVTEDPTNHNPEIAQVMRPDGLSKESPGSGTRLQPNIPNSGEGATISDVPVMAMPASYQKFTSQIDFGNYLMQQYHIRTANELSSCETCHR